MPLESTELILSNFIYECEYDMFMETFFVSFPVAEDECEGNETYCHVEADGGDTWSEDVINEYFDNRKYATDEGMFIKIKIISIIKSEESYITTYEVIHPTSYYTFSIETTFDCGDCVQLEAIVDELKNQN